MRHTKVLKILIFKKNAYLIKKNYDKKINDKLYKIIKKTTLRSGSIQKSTSLASIR